MPDLVWSFFKLVIRFLFRPKLEIAIHNAKALRANEEKKIMFSLRNNGKWNALINRMVFLFPDTFVDVQPEYLGIRFDVRYDQLPYIAFTFYEDEMQLRPKGMLHNWEFSFKKHQMRSESTK